MAHDKDVFVDFSRSKKYSQVAGGDLEVEHTHELGVAKRHNALSFVPGVLHGMELALRPGGAVAIQPGVAVAEDGSLIVLDDEEHVLDAGKRGYVVVASAIRQLAEKAWSVGGDTQTPIDDAESDFCTAVAALDAKFRSELVPDKTCVCLGEVYDEGGLPKLRLDGRQIAGLRLPCSDATVRFSNGMISLEGAPVRASRGIVIPDSSGAGEVNVGMALAKKADQSFVNTELDKKADQSFVNTELGKKANKADVEAAHGPLHLGSDSEVALLIDGVKKVVLDKNGNLGIGAPPDGHRLNVSGGPIKLGLEANGGGQLILHNNTDDNKIWVEAFSSDGNKHADELLFTGRRGDPVPRLSLVADNIALWGRVTVNGSLHNPRGWVFVGPDAADDWLRIAARDRDAAPGTFYGGIALHAPVAIGFGGLYVGPQWERLSEGELKVAGGAKFGGAMSIREGEETATLTLGRWEFRAIRDVLQLRCDDKHVQAWFVHPVPPG